MGPIAPPHACRRDIRGLKEENRREAYDVISRLRMEGARVMMHEYKAGFPSIMVDCQDIHILTDVVSLERWAKDNHGTNIFEVWPQE